MSILYDQLIFISKCALNNLEYEEAIDNIKELFRLARENGLSGLFYAVLKNNQSVIDEQRLLLKEYYLYQAKDIIQKQAIAEITSFFNHARIDHIYLKGSAIKKHYLESDMRSMGDIDLIIKPEDLERSRMILKSANYKLDIEGSTHDVYFKGRDIIVEVHPGVDHHLDSDHLTALGDVFADGLPISGCLFELSPEKELVYLLSHLKKHFLSSGVGLRQVLDIGVFLDKMEAKIDNEKLFDLLKTANLTNFAKNMISFNKQAFGFRIGEFILSGYRMADALFEETKAYVIGSGVHGTARDFNRSVPVLTKHSLKTGKTRGSKIRYLIRILFPKRIDLMSTEKYLKKHGWLLPYARIKRWIRLVFKKTRRSIAKLKALDAVDKEMLQSNLDLYRKLGIN